MCTENILYKKGTSMVHPSIKVYQYPLKMSFHVNRTIHYTALSTSNTHILGIKIPKLYNHSNNFFYLRPTYIATTYNHRPIYLQICNKENIIINDFDYD